MPFLLLGAAVLLTAAILRLAYGPGYLSVDGMWSLQWGDDLLAGHALSASKGTTPHPLSNLLGAVAQLAGRDGDLLLIAASYVAAGLLVVATAVLAWRLAGPAASVGAALLIATRPELVSATKAGMLDVWAAALLAVAVVAALPRGDDGRPDRPGVAQAALLAAGLLRPEAWALALAWWAWRAWTDRTAHLRQLAVALAAPVLWAVSDLILTGDALFAIHQTDAAAGLLREIQSIETGVRADVLRALDTTGYAVGATVLALLVVAVGLLAWLARPVGTDDRSTRCRAELFTFAVLAGFVGLLVLQAVGGTLVFPRFALLPAALACALVAVAAVRAADRLPVPEGAAVGVTVLIAVVPTLGSGGKLPSAHRASAAAQAGYTAARDALRPGVPCGPIGTTRTGLAIYAARWTGVPLGQIHEDLTAPWPGPASYVDVDRDPSAAFLRDSRTLPPIAAPGARPVRTTPGWQVTTTCP